MISSNDHFQQGPLSSWGVVVPQTVLSLTDPISSFVENRPAQM